MTAMLSLFFILISCSSCFSAVITPHVPGNRNELDEVVRTLHDIGMDGVPRFSPARKEEICQEIMTSTYFRINCGYTYLPKSEENLWDFVQLCEACYKDHYCEGEVIDAYPVTDKRPYILEDAYSFITEFSVFACLARVNTGAFIEIFVSYGYDTMMLAEGTFLIFQRMSAEFDLEARDTQMSEKLDYIGIAELNGKFQQPTGRVLGQLLRQERRRARFRSLLQAMSIGRRTRVCKIAFATLFDDINQNMIRAELADEATILLPDQQVRLSAPILRCLAGPISEMQFLYLIPSTMDQHIPNGVYILHKNWNRQSVYEITSHCITNIAALNERYLDRNDEDHH